MGITEDALSVPPARADRHPYEVALMLTTIVAAVWLIIDVAVHHRVTTVAGADASQAVWLSVTGITGAVLTLVGAWLPRDRDIRLSLQVGILGQFCIGCGGLWLIHNYLTTPSPIWPYTFSMACGVGIGAWWRVWEMGIKLSRVNDIVRRQQRA
jgi:hypothetical protein